MESPSTSSSLSERASPPPDRSQSEGRQWRMHVTRSNRFSSLFSHVMQRGSLSVAPSPSQRTAVESASLDNGVSSAPSSSTLPTSPTPPPSLPAPTLHELGMSLTSVTDHLVSSHLHTLPASGTFLAPNYLLLCHTDGLDVLPLTSPPAPRPYALVRRVCFKSVVVMEERGVLVAIAGRRDGVRVYALEEVKKAVRWRVDVEIRKEKENKKHDDAVDGSIMKADRMIGDLKPKDAKSRRKSISIHSSRSLKDTKATSQVKQKKSGTYTRDRETSGSIRNGLQRVRTGVSSIRPSTPDVSASMDGFDDESQEGHSLCTARESLSLAQMLLESRLPDIGPVGTRVPQQPILIAGGPPTVISDDEFAGLPDSLIDMHSKSSVRGPLDPTTRIRNPRPVSIFDGVFMPPSQSMDEAPAHVRRPSNHELVTGVLALQINDRVNGLVSEPRPLRSDDEGRTSSERPSITLQPPPPRAISPSSSPAPSPLPGPPLVASSGVQAQRAAASTRPTTPTTPTTPSTPSRRKRFPKILHQAFMFSRSNPLPKHAQRSLNGRSNESPTDPSLPQVIPPPKLEYVKLPGTKGAILIKAVETSKKSFLAILCGDAGEKVELFAGTYRTTLGLSRTFILPDSPRTLELQLQGDDLVEVFLVFAQNVFALEPATVRVREVRFDRAERRAHRRAREPRQEPVTSETTEAAEPAEPATGLSDDYVDVELDAIPDRLETPSSPQTVEPIRTEPSQSSLPPTYADESRQSSDEPSTPPSDNGGPYTTFQQLSFAPSFPCATIADDCIIPPTYTSVLQYRSEYELQEGENESDDTARASFCPPGLPIPIRTAPSKWFYKDPKGILRGPWKASMMQSWYKDGFLPADLPVRPQGDTEFILLKDLILQSLDPSQPFQPPPPSLNSDLLPSNFDSTKPLLPPISLLTQSRQYGPPSLFFATRAGHSTAIVDAKGRPVLKGRFNWSSDNEIKPEAQSIMRKMGDVKRLEAFDISNDKVIVVAVRQYGLEMMEIGDALLKPADESRSVLPYFQPAPAAINRRLPYVWRTGSPIDSISIAAKSSGSEPLDRDDVIYLGREGENVYLCERTVSSYRVLCLRPYSS